MEQVLYLFYKTFIIPIGELFYAEVWNLSDFILFFMGWDFGPYGSFQGCVVPHINGTYLCFPHDLSFSHQHISLSSSLYLSQIEACQ